MFLDTLADISKQQFGRAKEKYWPLEEELIASTRQFQTPQFLQEETGKAVADVAGAFGRAKEQTNADLASMGVNPNSGKYGFVRRGLALGEGLGEAGAFSRAREGVRRLSYDTLAGLAGKGDAKIGQSIGAAQAGGNQYAALQRNEMEWQNSNNDMAGLGSLVGLGLSFIPSSKKMKHGRRALPHGAATEAMRKMPVQSYRYRRGMGPPGEHVGPMAEDMQAATGMGDGKMIAAQDMMGLNMAATQELDRRVRRLEKKA